MRLAASLDLISMVGSAAEGTGTAESLAAFLIRLVASLDWSSWVDTAAVSAARLFAKLMRLADSFCLNSCFKLFCWTSWARY